MGSGALGCATFAPVKSFASDNYAGVLPQVMKALAHVNNDHARSYGADDVTSRVQKIIRSMFGPQAEAFFVFNGTGANVLCASAAVASHRSILVADISHFYNDEGSAPETVTGCRFFPLLSNDYGKVSPDAVHARCIRKGDVHYANPAMLSVTQSTEYGTVYTLEELAALAAVCKEHSLALHMDGSRLFNAAASLGCALGDLTAVGVDLLSLGGTKLGLMFGECVVVLNPIYAEAVRFKQKQVMQLASKTRFIAAQFEAILLQDTWRQVAASANAAAAKLAAGLRTFPQIHLTRPVEANAVFVTMPQEWIKRLQFVMPFYEWKEAIGEVRLMCAWDTSDDDIRHFLTAVNTLAKTSTAVQ